MGQGDSRAHSPRQFTERLPPHGFSRPCASPRPMSTYSNQPGDPKVQGSSLSPGRMQPGTPQVIPPPVRMATPGMVRPPPATAPQVCCTSEQTNPLPLAQEPTTITWTVNAGALPATEEEPSAMQECCPSCGRPYQIDTIFCDNCGMKRGPAPVVQVYSVESRTARLETQLSKLAVRPYEVPDLTGKKEHVAVLGCQISQMAEQQSRTERQLSALEARPQDVGLQQGPNLSSIEMRVADEERELRQYIDFLAQQRATPGTLMQQGRDYSAEIRDLAAHEKNMDVKIDNVCRAFEERFLRIEVENKEFERSLQQLLAFQLKSEEQLTLLESRFRELRCGLEFQQLALGSLRAARDVPEASAEHFELCKALLSQQEEVQKLKFALFEERSKMQNQLEDVNARLTKTDGQVSLLRDKLFKSREDDGIETSDLARLEKEMSILRAKISEAEGADGIPHLDMARIEAEIDHHQSPLPFVPARRDKTIEGYGKQIVDLENDINRLKMKNGFDEPLSGNRSRLDQNFNNAHKKAFEMVRNDVNNLLREMKDERESRILATTDLRNQFSRALDQSTEDGEHEEAPCKVMLRADLLKREAQEREERINDITKLRKTINNKVDTPGANYSLRG